MAINSIPFARREPEISYWLDRRSLVGRFPVLHIPIGLRRRRWDFGGAQGGSTHRRAQYTGGRPVPATASGGDAAEAGEGRERESSWTRTKAALWPPSLVR